MCVHMFPLLKWKANAIFRKPNDKINTDVTQNLIPHCIDFAIDYAL